MDATAVNMIFGILRGGYEKLVGIKCQLVSL